MDVPCGTVAVTLKKKRDLPVVRECEIVADAELYLSARLMGNAVPVH